MTICRYFAQGNCRFGDRCRFEHTESNYNSSNYNQRNVGNYQEQYGGQDTGRSNYNGNQYRNQGYESRKHENQRNYSSDRYSENYQGYESKNYYVNQRSYSPDRYSENYRYESPSRSTYENQHQSRSRQGYEHQPRYNEQNYGRNQQYPSQNYQNENAQGQNRYRWQAKDYKKQTYDAEHSRNEYANETYSTSTPKGKVSFSFKVPESEIRKETRTLFQINEEDQLHADMVKQEITAWEYGKQWPFTCYFPFPDKHGFPGFYDVSPEELRYAAYKAKKDNSYESYVQIVQNALIQIQQQRSQFQIITPQLLSIVKQIRDGMDLYTTSKMIDPIPLIQCNEIAVESMETPAFSAPADSAASFSFKMPTEETDSTAQTSATNFSFKLPAGTQMKSVTSAAFDGDPDIYTPMDILTEGEQEQFSASTFVLGKIPTKPPPQRLCS